MNLLFFNHYGVGDLFESREFVRDWMRLAGVTTARYAHRTLPGFFADLSGIESVEVTPEMDMRAAVTVTEDGRRKTVVGPASVLCPSSSEVWVNTWIGRGGDYVIHPGIGCTVEGLYRMHNDLLRLAGLPPLPRAIAEYLPVIDYTRLDLGNCHTWLDAHRGERLVLVCNGTTGSGQAVNFDMGDMVRALPPRPGVTYLLTHPLTGAPPLEVSGRGDLHYTDRITQRERRGVGAYGPCDFNVISYLSRFCSVIVGRCSGPQMGAQVMENWRDSTKTLLCFTHHRNGACFVLNPEALGLAMKVVWSPAATPLEAARVLEPLLQP